MKAFLFENDFGRKALKCSKVTVDFVGSFGVSAKGSMQTCIIRRVSSASSSSLSVDSFPATGLITETSHLTHKCKHCTKKTYIFTYCVCGRDRDTVVRLDLICVKVIGSMSRSHVEKCL